MYSYLASVIPIECTVIKHQLFLSNVQLFRISYSYRIRIIFKQFFYLPRDGNITGAITPAQSGPVSHGNEEVLHTPQISG